jgi:alkylhydroperoxidase/carboxymuconolactone decarboxylase family protein YurZ
MSRVEGSPEHDERGEIVEQEQRVRRLLERTERCPGYVYPFHEYLAEKDYEWAETYQSWYEQVRAPRWLPLKYKELLFITAACIKYHEPGIRTHVTKALELGATEEEILETIEVATHTGGGGVPVIAIRILLEVLEGG